MLHIHNGDSTAGTLREFGFPGEHFAFQDVLIVGPTPLGLSATDWRNLRAQTLAQEYELSPEYCERGLLRQEQTLESFSQHEETVLWFEHDLFCQVNLIYLLDWFSKHASGNSKLSTVCVGEFPGVEDFRGLGQLTGEQLASLFDGRSAITARELNLAARAWKAYCSTDPEDISRLLDEDTSALPFLNQALKLHLARFPSARNGLGRIENMALELIAEGDTEFKSLFPKFAKLESAYGLGDAQFWNEIRPLARGCEPLITIIGLGDDESGLEDNRFHKASFALTGAGRSVLAGERDFIEMNGIDQWLGGAQLSDASHWRWDEREQKLVHSD